MYGGPPPREEDATPADNASDLPSLEQAKPRVPAKTQVLMEELFRATLEKVQRINPKSIR